MKREFHGIIDGMAKTSGHVQTGPVAVEVTATTRPAHQLHVRNIETLGNVSEAVTGDHVVLTCRATIRIRPGSSPDVVPADIVAEHVRVNLGLSEREVKVGSFLTSGELQTGIIQIDTEGGTMDRVGLGRGVDVWTRLKFTTHLPNRTGQATAYRLATKRLQQTLMLLATSPCGLWPVTVEPI